MSSAKARMAAVVALAFTLAGCTVGPDFERPTVHPPNNWHALKSAETPNASAVTTQPAQLARWWTVFDDPTLTALIQDALKGNLNLRRARLRIREARARLAMAQGRRLPSISAGASYRRKRVSQNGIASTIGGAERSRAGRGRAPAPPIPGGALGEFNLFQAGFDASWELDLFGGSQRHIEATKARLAAAVANRRAVRVSLVAEVARNYFMLRGAQRRLEIARKSLYKQQALLQLTRDLQKAGMASQQAVNRIAARVAQTRAALPPLRTRKRRAMHRLSLLLGNYPGTLAERLTEPAALPEVPPQVPIGLPSSLLRRRPDIRRAEHKLHAATAEVGVAVSRLFPQISLTGSFGFQSTEFEELAVWESRFFGIGPSIRIPIFQQGRLRARVQVQKAQRKQALVRYRRTVLNAFREVADAITAYRNVQARRRALAKRVAHNREAVALALSRYQQGLTDYLAVLDAQTALLRSKDALAQASVAVRTKLVALYKALGGGWRVAQAGGTSVASESRK